MLINIVRSFCEKKKKRLIPKIQKYKEKCKWELYDFSAIQISLPFLPFLILREELELSGPLLWDLLIQLPVT